jgi:hypothetical protein
MKYEIPPSISDRDATDLTNALFTHWIIPRPNVYMEGFLITSDESDQYISYLFYKTGH